MSKPQAPTKTKPPRPKSDLTTEAIDELPSIHYCVKSGDFVMQMDENRYMPMDGRSVKQQLMLLGVPVNPEDIITGQKDGDKILAIAQRDNWVSYAGPLAGHKCGLIKTPAGDRLLVTNEAQPIQPKAGKWERIERFLSQLLTVPDEKTSAEQFRAVLYWLKVSWEALTRGDLSPGQMLVLAGPAGCGKSFFQELVTRLLGGRAAKPFRYMDGQTPFNEDLAQAEHLFMADEKSSQSTTARRKMGNALNDMVVNQEMSVHGKGKTAFTASTYRRLTLTVNFERENVMIVPPMEDSIASKITLLICSHAKLSPDKRKNIAMLEAELPAMIHDLAKMQIPKSLRCDRFGVVHYHNPELLEMLSDMSPEQRLLALIEEVITLPFEGSAEKLEQALRASNFTSAVERVLQFNSACGTYLARLSTKYPHRIRSKKITGKTVWEIQREGE